MSDAALEWNYTHGVRNPERVNPDSWMLQRALLSRPGNKDAMLALLVDYGNNLGHYDGWQAYFRKHQPPALIVWGRNDQIFPAEGARAYLRDLPRAELHLLDTGHFALEDKVDEIASLMSVFLGKVNQGSWAANDQCRTISWHEGPPAARAVHVRSDNQRSIPAILVPGEPADERMRSMSPTTSKMRQNRLGHRVVMLGYPQAQILDITGPLEVFARTSRWLRDHRDLQRNAYEIELVAPTAGWVETSGGLEPVCDPALCRRAPGRHSPGCGRHRS